MRIGILSAELGQEDIHENKRLAREIILKGHRPKIINYRKTVIAIHKNHSRLYQPDKKGVLREVRVEAVIPRINETGDDSIHLATLALECLITSGAYSTANPAAIRLAKNKITSMVALAGGKVPIPRTAAITGTESYEVDFDRVLNVVEPNPNKRLIVKTNAGTHGKGVMAVDTRGEARAIMDGFLANNIPVLLQQFVEPSKKNTYFDLRFVVVNGQVVGAMKRLSTKKDEIRTNLSLGGKGLRHEPTDSEIEIAGAATKAMGLSVAGVDIIPSGKNRLVLEVNSSPGFMIEDVAKVNVAKKMVQMAISGANKGKKTSPEKLAELLNTEIKVPKMRNLPKVRHLPKPIRPRQKYS